MSKIILVGFQKNYKEMEARHVINKVAGENSLLVRIVKTIPSDLGLKLEIEVDNADENKWSNLLRNISGVSMFFTKRKKDVKKNQRW